MRLLVIARHGGRKYNDPSCTNIDIVAIDAIINEAAQAHRGVISADCWHEQ